MSLNHAKRKTTTTYQSLEDRRLLAGNVTVFESVNLYIRGDQSDNQFEVVANGDQLEIKGLEGTTINGKDSYLISGTQVTESGVTFAGGLRAHLGPGNDDFAVIDAQFESMSLIYGGTGNDNIDVVDSQFLDKTTIQTYEGDDSISTAGSLFSDTLFAITLAGQDSVSMVDTVMNGNSIVVTGDHRDSVYSEDNHYMGEVNLLLTLDGDDKVQLMNPVVGDSQLGVFLGNGSDNVYGTFAKGAIESSVRIGGQSGVDSSNMSMGDKADSQIAVLTIEEMNDLVFDNKVDDFGGVNAASDAFFHTENLNLRNAADVQVAETQTVRQISWTGSYGGDLNQEFPAPYEVDDFTVEIYEGTSEIPVGEPIASFHVGNDVNRTDIGKTIGPLGIKKLYSYSAEIDATLEADKTYWVSIYAQVQDDIRAGSVGGDFVTFQWGIRSLFGTSGSEIQDNPSVYTYGDRTTTDPGWFDSYGGIYDFQLWS